MAGDDSVNSLHIHTPPHTYRIRVDPLGNLTVQRGLLSSAPGPGHTCSVDAEELRNSEFKVTLASTSSSAPQLPGCR